MTVRLLEELTELEKLNLVSLSYSRIGSMEGPFGCEAKYFYTYIAGEPRVFGEAATLGNVLHDVLEERLEPNVPITEELLEQLVQKYKEKLIEWDPENKIPEKLISEGDVMLSEFVDRHMGESFPIAHKEMHFQIVVGRALVSGYIDRVDVEGDKVVILDYKSGKNEVALKHIHNDLQLGIYALAAQKLFPGKEIHANLYYLRSGKIKGHLFSDDDLLSVQNRLADAVDKLTTIQNFNTTSNSRICYWCDHAKSGACAIGVRRTSR